MGQEDFPPTDWAALGKKVAGHDNLFALLDYFFCQNVSSAEAERGFSVLKETETSKRAILSNFYLSNQMRIILSGTPLNKFNFDEAIDVWMGFKKTKRGIGN